MRSSGRRLPLILALSTALVLGICPDYAAAAPPKGGGLELPDVDLGTAVDGGPAKISPSKQDGRSAVSVTPPAAPAGEKFEADIPGVPAPSAPQKTTSPTGAPRSDSPSPSSSPATSEPATSGGPAPTPAEPTPSSTPNGAPGSPPEPTSSASPERSASASLEPSDAPRAAPTPAAPSFAPAGESGISVAAPAAAAGGQQQTAGSPPAVSRIAGEVLDVESAAKSGVEGLALRVARADGAEGAAPVDLRIEDSLLSDRFGADYASRAVWALLPDCAAGSDGCGEPIALAAVHDADAGMWTVSSVPVSSSPMVVAALSSVASPTGTGDFGASALSPSGTWQVSAQTGDFSWSYPLRVPPASAGPQPDLALTYASGSVDGKTGSTNNQPSWVGEGWALSTGFVERAYSSCSNDTAGGGPSTGDYCWKGENLTLSLNGRSSVLVRDTTSGVWRLREDDGSRIEQLTGASNGDDNGEYWRLTTQDGTQYTFGLNHLPGWTGPAQDTQSTWTVPVFGNDAGEPCSTGTFATSWCQQAWRWNLDYVVDTHANSEAFYYAPETNQYGRNLSATTPTAYTRGGTLARIDYAMRAGSELTAPAPAQVVFDIADRCVTPGATCTSGTPANWPDVPWDRNCTGSPCTGNLSPTFWSTKRLSAVRTQIYSAGGGTYGNVDTWTLTQTYPDPGDTTSASLWLSKISHSGNVGGTAAVPDVEISGSSSANRVRAVDGLLPLVKWRVSSIKTESGAVISVNYSAKECSNTVLPASAETNTMRCFPQWWTPPVGPSKLDYFHKYVVTSVIADAVTGGAQPTDQTYYDYTGTPAWHYDDSALTPDDKRTWSEYHGYSTVRIRHGDLNTPAKQTVTDYRFFQGMNGDRLNPAGGAKSVTVPASDASSWADDRWLQGRIREQITYNGVGGPAVTGTITDPWASAPTASSGVWDARFVNDAESRTRLALASGWRNTRTIITYNGDGLPTAVDDLGDTATGADDRCTRTSYAPNTTAWITAAPYQVTTVGVSCGATPALPADALADVRTYYDTAATASTPPTQGSPTRVEVVKSYTGSTPNWLTTATSTYDALGRATSAVDALSRTTTTSYAPAAGLVTSASTTNTAAFTTSTTIRPEWGAPATVVDPNGKTTAATYDPLGRRTGMWATDRPQATYPASPTVAYRYSVSNSAPTVVTTTTLNSTGGTNTSYALFDGLLRPRQTQSPSQGGGTVVTDTLYDAAGRVESTHAGYWITTAPSGTLYSASLSLIPARTVRQFDGAGRETANILYVLGAERWRTSTAYYGDHTDITPPAGASATSTYADARGNITARIQWQTNAPGGLHDDTYYGFDKGGRLASIIDPAGNSWAYGYDTLGRKTTAHDPDAGDSSYTYDDGGRTTSSTDGRGQVLAYVYDGLDRRTELRESSAAGTLLASWVYDTLAKGQLTSSTRYDATGQYKTETTGYDDAYRSLGQKVTIPALGSLATTYITTNTYWPNGSLKSTALPAMGGLPAETLRWGYTSIGLPYTFSGPSLISYVNTAVYTHTGLLAQLNQNGPGTTTVKNLYYEDGTDRLQRTVASSYSAGAGAIEDRNYSYDNAGNTTKIKNDGTGTSGASDTQCFGYDYLRQLTQAWTPTSTSCASAPTSTTLGGPAPYWKTYSYNKIGNRTQDVVKPITSGGATTTTTYSYPVSGAAAVRPHAATSQSVAVSPGSTTSTAYGYDNGGNTTTRGTAQTFTYNSEGRQAGYSASTSGPTSSAVYDADGNRMTYTDATGTTLYLGGTEIKSTTAGLSAVRTYTFNGQTIAVRTSTAGVSGTVMSWIDPDHQNSATVATNSTTGVKTRRYNDPYGNTRGTAPAFPGGHGFLDKPVDTLSATTHLGAREYLGTAGRFLQPDPVMTPTDPLSLNAYAYAQNTPVVSADPSGLCPPDKCGDGGGIGVGLKGGLIKGGTTGSALQLTPHISLDANVPNADEIQKGFEDWADRLGYGWDTDDARWNSFNEVVALQSYCITEGGKLCGSALTKFLTDWYLAYPAYGPGDYELLANTVLGMDGLNTPTLNGSDYLGLIASGGAYIGGSGGKLEPGYMRPTPSWLQTVKDKIPAGWTSKPTRSEGGITFSDPNRKQTSIRIDTGNPNNSQVSQQGDHVVINDGGRIIGRDGKPLPGDGSLKNNWEQGHIPLEEWKTWRQWNQP